MDKEELITLYQEYCDFIEEHNFRCDIGVEREERVKRDFGYFMKWLEVYDMAYFGEPD